MKSHLFLSLLAIIFLMSGSVLSAQNSNIIITEKGKLIKNKVYTKCDIELTSAQLISVFSKDPKYKEYAKPIMLNYLAGTILKSAASLLILWPVTESFYDNSDPNWNLAYIGAGCALLAIPFNKAFDRHAEKAVKYYNSAGEKTGSVDIKFGPGSNGVGLVVNF
jgi:hypothetical protein